MVTEKLTSNRDKSLTDRQKIDSRQLNAVTAANGTQENRTTSTAIETGPQPVVPSEQSFIISGPGQEQVWQKDISDKKKRLFNTLIKAGFTPKSDIYNKYNQEIKNLEDQHQDPKVLSEKLAELTKEAKREVTNLSAQPEIVSEEHAQVVDRFSVQLRNIEKSPLYNDAQTEVKIQELSDTYADYHNQLSGSNQAAYQEITEKLLEFETEFKQDHLTAISLTLKSTQRLREQASSKGQEIEERRAYASKYEDVINAATNDNPSLEEISIQNIMETLRLVQNHNQIVQLQLDKPGIKLPPRREEPEITELRLEKPVNRDLVVINGDLENFVLEKFNAFREEYPSISQSHEEKLREISSNYLSKIAAEDIDLLEAKDIAKQSLKQLAQLEVEVRQELRLADKKAKQERKYQEYTNLENKLRKLADLLVIDEKDKKVFSKRIDEVSELLVEELNEGVKGALSKAAKALKDIQSDIKASSKQNEIAVVEAPKQEATKEQQRVTIFGKAQVENLKLDIRLRLKEAKIKLGESKAFQLYKKELNAIYKTFTPWILAMEEADIKKEPALNGLVVISEKLENWQNIKELASIVADYGSILKAPETKGAFDAENRHTYTQFNDLLSVYSADGKKPEGFDNALSIMLKDLNKRIGKIKDDIAANNPSVMARKLVIRAEASFVRGEKLQPLSIRQLGRHQADQIFSKLERRFAVLFGAKESESGVLIYLKHSDRDFYTGLKRSLEKSIQERRFREIQEIEDLFSQLQQADFAVKYFDMNLLNSDEDGSHTELLTNSKLEEAIKEKIDSLNPMAQELLKHYSKYKIDEQIGNAKNHPNFSKVTEDLRVMLVKEQEKGLFSKKKAPEIEIKSFGQSFYINQVIQRVIAENQKIAIRKGPVGMRVKSPILGSIEIENSY